MTVTLQDIVNAVEPLNDIVDREIPVRLAYKLMTLSDEVNEHQKRYEKLRRELVQKYGEPVYDEEGNDTGQIQVKQDQNEAFIQEHRDLLANEVEISTPSITLSELEGAGNIKTWYLMRLRPFIDDESSE